MMRYALTFDDIATAATANTLKTLAALIVAATTGHRIRLRSLRVGPSDDTPSDANVSIRLERVADVSAGSAGTPTNAITAANMPKLSPGGQASIATGGTDYSGEPSAFETEPLFEMDMNARGGFIQEWGPGEGPEATEDMLLALRAAPRASAAVRLSGSMEFEVF